MLLLPHRAIRDDKSHSLNILTTERILLMIDKKVPSALKHFSPKNCFSFGNLTNFAAQMNFGHLSTTDRNDFMTSETYEEYRNLTF